MLDLERVAKLLPDEWIAEDRAISLLAQGMKLPAHDRSVARGVLKSSLLVFGLAEFRASGPGCFEWRRSKPAQQVSAKKKSQVWFHRDPVITNIPQVREFAPEPWPPATV